MKAMKIGYARVSTKLQSLEVQRDLLNKEDCVTIYEDKLSGTQKDRPQFNDMLESLKTGDTLVVTKLDRLARNSRDALNVVGDLFEKGVKIHVLNIGLIEDTAFGNVIFNIMMAFAQFERDMIVERVNDGLRIARQDPTFVSGRPRKFTDKQINRAIEFKKTMSYTAVTEETGISKSTLHRAIVKKKALEMEAESKQEQPIA